MRCETCAGDGYKIHQGIGAIPCPSCNGSGVGHCCDGLREQPANEFNAIDHRNPDLPRGSD